MRRIARGKESHTFLECLQHLLVVKSLVESLARSREEVSACCEDVLQQDQNHQGCWALTWTVVKLFLPLRCWTRICTYLCSLSPAAPALLELSSASAKGSASATSRQKAGTSVLNGSPGDSTQRAVGAPDKRDFASQQASPTAQAEPAKTLMTCAGQWVTQRSGEVKGLPKVTPGLSDTSVISRGDALVCL